MQINFTLDTNQPGDIIALRKLTDALTNELRKVDLSVEFSKMGELAPVEKPVKKAKPQAETTPTPPAEEPAQAPAPKPEKAERVTIEQVRTAIQSKNIDDCKKVLVSKGVKALADAPAELLPEILAAINELPNK